MPGHEIMNCFLIVSLVTLAAVASLLFPIETYVTTLSSFGIAHVLIELRYIDTEYFQILKRRYDQSLLFWIVNLLLAIAVCRCLIILGWVPDFIGLVLELIGGFGLVVLAVRLLLRESWPLFDRKILLRQGFGVAIAALFLVGLCQSPVTTLVILAIIHNLTPIGFIHDRRQSSGSNRVATALIFGVLPLIVFGMRYLGSSWFSNNVGSPHLATFVPPAWQQLSIALPLFAAVTFCQCMHYAAVLGLFSQWTRSRAESLIPWPDHYAFYGIVGLTSGLFFLAFQTSFFTTRIFYGVFASIHAWVEIPLLLVLLIPHGSTHTTVD
jgi:hypothetical protein